MIDEAPDAGGPATKAYDAISRTSGKDKVMK
jgi:hypothetical protein